MMVTACNDDQSAVCVKASGLSPLLNALEGKGGASKEKLGAYKTISERLKSDKDATLSREICHHTAQLTCIVSVDIMNDDAELNQAALQALGFCLHLPDISRAFTPDDASTIVKALCNALLKTNDKSTCTRALWCLSKQSFPHQIIKNELHTVLCALEHALVQGGFQSMTVEYEALNVIIRLLEDLPEDMLIHTARWGKFLFPYTVRSAPKIRERAACAMQLGLPAMLQHQPEIIPGLVTDLKSTLVPEMMKLFAGKCEIHVLKIWGNFVTLLGKALHKGGLINCLLGVVEQGFKHTSPDVKLASFIAWRVLIDNFSLEPDVLYNTKRLKLLLQPLRATNAKQELVAQAKLDTWWYLVYRLGPKAPMNFDQVCAPLLQYCLGLNTNINGTQCPSTPLAANGTGLRQGFTTPLRTPHLTTPQRKGSLLTMTSPATPRLSLPPSTPGGTAPIVFKSVQLQGVEILARVLGMPSDAVGTAPKYNFTINVLTQPMITSSTAFIKLSSTLVPMVRDVICNLGDQLDEGLLFHLWYSLVIHVSDMVTTATKKDSVEVLTQFLTSLQCIVGASRLAPNNLLKFLEAVSHLPKTVLGSPSYHASNAGLMHGTPALFLIELLLSQGLMETSTNERFFCVLETLIDCGLTVPGTVLRFSGSVLQLVSKAATDLTNKDITWRMWSSIVYPLLGHIIGTNEVNQGDSLDHDFSTMYASLVLPVQYLLPCGTLPQMTLKTLLKTWSELYQAFTRCAAVVTTADSNLGCEELCTKMLASLDKQSLNSSYVDSMAQILHVIANNVDFTPFTVSTAPINLLTPGRMGRGRVWPLGNLTAFVRLVVRVIEAIQNQVKTERSKFAGLFIQSSGSYMSSVSISTMANVLSILFTNVSQPIIIEALLDKLAGPVSCFYDNTGAFKSSAYSAPTWQKLEKLWTDLLTSVQTRYGGPYNSAFLAVISPLLQSGLMHPKRAIKSHGLVFWNATFATVDSLEYPEPLQVCLAKLKEKTLLVLPGWTDTEPQVVNETPTSQLDESEVSQSLIPPPAVSTIPNFGAPSPQKMHGSFLRRTAQAERLFAASSPERYKNPSPFGKSNKRSISPGKGVFRGLSSPVGSKGKRDASPGVSGAAARRRLHVDEESMGEFVFIAPSPKKTQVLTDHQKEMMRTRRVLPALYNDLEQSQDVQTFSEIMSQTETTQDSPQVEQDGGKTISTSESPSVFSFLKKQLSLSEEIPQNSHEKTPIDVEKQTLAAKEFPKSVRKEYEELNDSKTRKGEPKKGDVEKEEKGDEVCDGNKDEEGKTLTFAGILSKMKKSEDQASVPSLEVTSNGMDEVKQAESVPCRTTEVESCPISLREKPLRSNEGMAEIKSCSPEKNSKDLLPTTSENAGNTEEEKRVKLDDIVEDFKENSDLHDAGNEDVKGKEEEIKDVETGKEEQKVLAKDSTDEEEGDVEQNVSVGKSVEYEFIVPETQQSQSAKVADKEADGNFVVSPVRVASDSQPTDLKLNLTPIIKLQKLKEADLLRLSPDPSKCSFAKLDINSSPKVFTSSEEESTPNWFAARLRRLHSDETSRDVKKNFLKRAVREPVMQSSESKAVVQKRTTRGKSRRVEKKSLQSSQADLAELAERFELDGIEPLADETDMDQSMDHIDNDSQSKEVSIDVLNKESIPKKDIENERERRGQRKVRGKKKIDLLAKPNTSFECYAADESTSEDINDTKLKTEQGSRDTEESENSETIAVKVPKKRGRKRRVKPTSLSPVEEASNLLPPTITEQTMAGREKMRSQMSTRNGCERSGVVDPKKEALQEETFEAPPGESTSTTDIPTDEPIKCPTESKSVEKETLHLKDSEESGQTGSSSCIPDCQVEERQLNSCDDLFESCPKDISEEETTQTGKKETMSVKSKVPKVTKHSRHLSKSKLGMRKRKSRSWDRGEDSEEDNVPLAKIRHCYLDVESQTSESEVDFPKKPLPASQAEKSSMVVGNKDDVQSKDTETKQLTNVKTRRSEKRLAVKSPKMGPKTSPTASFAKKILGRAKKSSPNSLNCKKSSLVKPIAKAKVAAKISPVATRLRTSKHLSSLSMSVPSKLSRKPRRVSTIRQEKDGCKPSNKTSFEEKLEKVVLQEVVDDVLTDEFESLWKDLSPVAGLSTSLPLPDSKSLLSPSPVSFIEEDIHEKDIGFTNLATVFPSGIPPATEQDGQLDALSEGMDLIIDSEAAESEEILSSSLEVSETMAGPTEEAMECSSVPESMESATESQDSASKSSPLDGCTTIAEKPTTLPQSPVIPIKFAPSCHSSPTVCGAANFKLAHQGSPSGSIPAMYSPSGSPSGGILKRKDSASPSPLNKSRRVSFAEPISEHSPVKHFAVELIPPEPLAQLPSKTPRLTHPPSPLVTTTPSMVVTVHSKFITTPSRRSSSSGFSVKSRVCPSGRRVSPGVARRREARQQGFVTSTMGRKMNPVKQSSQNTQGSPLTQQNSLDNSIGSDYDNQDSVFPDLAECCTPVERILPQLTSSMWSRGLGQLVRARNILTVGDLCSLSPMEIRSLPIRSPKISNLRKVMTNFQNQQLGKTGTPLMSKKKDEGAQDPLRSEDGGSVMSVAKGKKVVEEGALDKQECQIHAVPSETPSKETASTSNIEPSQPKQRPKRKHEELDNSNTENSDEERLTKPKQAKIVDKLEELMGEFATEKLAQLPSDRLFQAHQHVNSMMESIMAALKVKVKSPSLNS